VSTAVALIGALVVLAALMSTTSSAVTAAERQWTCLPGTTPADLDRLFVSEPGGVVGADYQRTTPLPDGRVLWTFQDAEVRTSNGSTTLVHNIGMVQNANCFSVLIGGTAADPRPWLFSESTTPFVRWFWPLGAEVGVDGRVYIFAAEMYERSPGYLVRTEPTSTVVAVVDIATWTMVGATARPIPAPTSTAGRSSRTARGRTSSRSATGSSVTTSTSSTPPTIRAAPTGSPSVVSPRDSCSPRPRTGRVEAGVSTRRRPPRSSRRLAGW